MFLCFSFVCYMYIYREQESVTTGNIDIFVSFKKRNQSLLEILIFFRVLKQREGWVCPDPKELPT